MNVWTTIEPTFKFQVNLDILNPNDERATLTNNRYFTTGINLIRDCTLSEPVVADVQI